MNKTRLLLLSIAILLSGCCTLHKGHSSRRDLSPINYGYLKAKTGVERYQVLYKTHSAAVAAGVSVSYKGITSVDIEIPKDAKSIPLSFYNDFSGVVFNVRNIEKDYFLFEYVTQSTSINVDKKDIDKGVFRRYSALARGKHLLVVTDDNPWVLNREGYSYGHIRKDILLVERGKSKNKPVMPYNNAYSSPSCKIYPVSRKGLQISNITLNRSVDSQKKTYLCNIQGADNLSFVGVTIKTPPNQGESDTAIRIIDCTNVSFDNVIIDGTYSRTDRSGYGVSMNNVWNFKAKNMVGKGNWGVFGTNNVNVASFEDCDINRFDIHCYGRDASFKNVTFRDKYNQFASVFGKIRFDNCTFINFCPVLNGTSYNSYVGYDIVMNDCTFDVYRGKNILIDQGRVDDVINARPELTSRCIPNVSINNLNIILYEDVPNIFLFYFRGDAQKKKEFEYLSNLIVKGVTFNYQAGAPPANFYISNISLPLTRTIRSTFEDIDIIGNASINKKGQGRFVMNLNTLSPKTETIEDNINAVGAGGQ